MASIWLENQGIDTSAPCVWIVEFRIDNTGTESIPTGLLRTPHKVSYYEYPRYQSVLLALSSTLDVSQFAVQFLVLIRPVKLSAENAVVWQSDNLNTVLVLMKVDGIQKNTRPAKIKLNWSVAPSLVG